jgi:hypothetical protein
MRAPSRLRLGVDIGGLLNRCCLPPIALESHIGRLAAPLRISVRSAFCIDRET